MESTTNSIALCAANTSAKGRFGTQYIDLMKYPNFKPNGQLSVIEPAQSAIEFVALREKLQANTSLADPAKGLRSLASWYATSYNRITADAQGNLIGGVTRDARKYLDIDSKLSRLYAGEGSISIIKQPKNTRKRTRSSRRTAMLRAKQADRQHISLLVCCIDRSYQKQNLMHLCEATSAHLRVGASA